MGYMPIMAFDISGDALSAVSQWLGFETEDIYLHTLPVEQEKIFERAQY